GSSRVGGGGGGLGRVSLFGDSRVGRLRRGVGFISGGSGLDGSCHAGVGLIEQMIVVLVTVLPVLKGDDGLSGRVGGGGDSNSRGGLRGGRGLLGHLRCGGLVITAGFLHCISGGVEGRIHLLSHHSVHLIISLVVVACSS
ncbi:hypothetical protein PMAYCL1PPCAC_13598, partial [Pristionchus mayeri]